MRLKSFLFVLLVVLFSGCDKSEEELDLPDLTVEQISFPELIRDPDAGKILSNSKGDTWLIYEIKNDGMYYVLIDTNQFIKYKSHNFVYGRYTYMFDQASNLWSFGHGGDSYLEPLALKCPDFPPNNELMWVYYESYPGPINERCISGNGIYDIVVDSEGKPVLFFSDERDENNIYAYKYQSPGNWDSLGYVTGYNSSEFAIDDEDDLYAVAADGVQKYLKFNGSEWVDLNYPYDDGSYVLKFWNDRLYTSNGDGIASFDGTTWYYLEGPDLLMCQISEICFLSNGDYVVDGTFRRDGMSVSFVGLFHNGYWVTQTMTGGYVYGKTTGVAVDIHDRIFYTVLGVIEYGIAEVYEIKIEY